MTRLISAPIFLNDRMISLELNAIFSAVSMHDGQPVIVDLGSVPDGEDGESFAAVGVAMSADDINQHTDFLKVFEVDAYPGDLILVRVDDTFVFGEVTAASANFVSALLAEHEITDLKKAFSEKGTFSNSVIVESKDVFVISPVPRVSRAYTPSPGDLLTVISPKAGPNYGKIVVFDEIDPANGAVKVTTSSGDPLIFRAISLAPYTLEEHLVIDTQTPVSEGSIQDEAAEDSDLFGADFVPMIPFGEKVKGLPHISKVLGACFSKEEVELIGEMQNIDPEFGSNMLGAVILGGRQIDDSVLRTILEGTIPYGFSTFVPDATVFFKEIGSIAKEQAEERIKRINAFFANDAQGEGPDLDFTSPAEIAFSRITGIRANDARDIFGGNLTHLGVDAIARRYAEDAADGQAQAAVETGNPPQEVIDALTGMLDEIFGAGNYEIVDEKELDDGVDVAPVDASDFFAEAQKIADALTEEDKPDDIYGDVAKTFGVSRDEAKKAVYEAIYGGTSVVNKLGNIGEVHATLTSIQEGLQIVRGDLNGLLKTANYLNDFVDALDSDIHSLRGMLPNV